MMLLLQFESIQNLTCQFQMPLIGTKDLFREWCHCLMPRHARQKQNFDHTTTVHNWCRLCCCDDRYRSLLNIYGFLPLSDRLPGPREWFVECMRTPLITIQTSQPMKVKYPSNKTKHGQKCGNRNIPFRIGSRLYNT